ncbi:uncharacterized protein B0H18DRAFT_1015544, partial [Fomitopsis serialis]|uniref:uncharacterized protein n=1 Tax=Fomitopsis serialis TaxID=139415 RepID=UPI002007659B
MQLICPPWACAFVVATISDHIRRRFLFAVSFTALAFTGHIMLLVVHDNTNLQHRARYADCDYR